MATSYHVVVQEENESLNSDIYPRKMDFTFGENESSCPAIILFHPRLSPHGNFSSFQADENFFIFKIFETSQ